MYCINGRSENGYITSSNAFADLQWLVKVSPLFYVCVSEITKIRTRQNTNGSERDQTIHTFIAGRHWWRGGDWESDRNAEMVTPRRMRVSLSRMTKRNQRQTSFFNQTIKVPSLFWSISQPHFKVLTSLAIASGRTGRSSEWLPFPTMIRTFFFPSLRNSSIVRLTKSFASAQVLQECKSTISSQKRDSKIRSGAFHRLCARRPTYANTTDPTPATHVQGEEKNEEDDWAEDWLLADDDDMKRKERRGDNSKREREKNGARWMTEASRCTARWRENGTFANEVCRRP